MRDKDEPPGGFQGADPRLGGGTLNPRTAEGFEADAAPDYTRIQ